MMEIQDIIRLFHKETPLRSRLREIRLEQHDSRWTLQVDFPKASYMIKLAANGFTTEARVSRWNDIINAYRQMGYYSPALLPSMYGRFAEKSFPRSRFGRLWIKAFIPVRTGGMFTMTRCLHFSAKLQKSVFPFSRIHRAGRD